MTYTLLRGADLLGRVEMRRVDQKFMSGLLIPRDAHVSLPGETQMRVSAPGQAPAVVVTVREEPEVMDAPSRRRTGEASSGALQPVTEDMKVEPRAQLRLLDDENEIHALSIGLHERRYLNDVPADVQLQMPVGSLRGRSYWEVDVFLEIEHGTSDLNDDRDDMVRDDEEDDITP
jgi:hypothetical protein